MPLTLQIRYVIYSTYLLAQTRSASNGKLNELQHCPGSQMFPSLSDTGAIAVTPVLSRVFESTTANFKQVALCNPIVLGKNFGIKNGPLQLVAVCHKLCAKR